MTIPRAVDRAGLQRLIQAESAVLVEVLPRPEYEWAHLPDALHLPLKRWDTAHVRSQLDVARPVIVYCHDST